jgi:hypothetical protein
MISPLARYCSIIHVMKTLDCSYTSYNIGALSYSMVARSVWRRSAWLLGLLCLFLATYSSQPSVALQVAGLYSQKVPVLNESNSERNRAFGEALAAVIVKVTGEQRWLLDPVVVNAVRNAQSYVERVKFSGESIPSEIVEARADDASSSVQGTTANLDASAEISELTAAEVASTPGVFPAPAEAVTAPPTEQRFINVDFSATLINELLLDAKIPVWDSNRPSVLVWMALQDEVGDRSLLSSETNPEIVKLIRDFADERGLPIIFPVLDFEDRRNVTEDTIWSLDESVVRQASERYGADSIMSGRLHFTAGGDLVGVWQFIFQDQTLRFDGYDKELMPYLSAPLDKITTQLASYFAIVPETSDFEIVQLRVDGVGTLQAYSSLMTYVNALGLVESATTVALDGERLDLRLSLLGNPNQLAELIALDRDLLPIQSISLENQLQLHYRWTR